MSPDVEATFQSYPAGQRQNLLRLRKLILDVAAGLPGAGNVEETLKWGEPSYRVESGSPIRLGWKASRPEHYAMYFNCNTKLVDTFRQLYADDLRFEGNRAIVFHRDDAVPADVLKHCIELALRYRDLRHLPLLGA